MKREDPTITQLYFLQCDEIAALELENKRLKRLAHSYYVNPDLKSNTYLCSSVENIASTVRDDSFYLDEIFKLEKEKRDLQDKIVDLEKQNTQLFESHLELKKSMEKSTTLGLSRASAQK